MRAILSHRALLVAAAAAITAATMQHEAQAAKPADPAAQVQTLNAALIASMKAGKSEAFATRMAQLQPALDQVLDLPAILQASVGLSWSTLTPQQQSALLDTFRRYTEANYAANFDSYDNQTFQVSPNYRVLSPDRVIVSTTLVNPNGNQHRIDYVMHRTADGAWKATDVLADGTISRVAVQRSDFSAVLSRGGIAGLQSRLAGVTASLGPLA